MIGVLGSTANKSLPANTMAKLIDEVALKTQGDILFNYIPNQETEAKEIYNLCNIDTKRQIHFDVFGKSLRQFITILSQCDLLVGNEGGAVNMAKALDIPTFTVFSPWIKKEVWNMFEDGKKHLSTHLADFEPETYQGKDTYKVFKSQAAALYRKFTPERIIPILKIYLKGLSF